MKKSAACNRHETIKQANKRVESEAGFIAAPGLLEGPNQGKDGKIDRSCERINHLSSNALLESLSGYYSIKQF
jgi:hypothetical protein